MTDAIAARFATAVSLHIVANLRPAPGPGTPLLLGIQGPAGEGKTYQVERVLTDAGIHSVLLSGGELESESAGDPAARMRAAYTEAGRYADGGTPAAVLLNDADAAIGSWGPLTQYTVNTQIFITELMHLADYPTRVEGKRTRRIPIILTGNDFTRLYGPLRRSGRMRIFTWRMEPAERAAALRSLFPWLSEHESAGLVHRFPDQPIAFWAAVRRRLEDDALTIALNRHGFGVLVRGLIAGSEVQIDDRAFSTDEIAETAKAVAAETAQDYLSS